MPVCRLGELRLQSERLLLLVRVEPLIVFAVFLRLLGVEAGEGVDHDEVFTDWGVFHDVNFSLVAAAHKI